MLSINGKKFMNLPEAVQWLLNNNALPFQCKVNYVADTVIAKTDIINPSPAEIKVGSLVLFADSKVGTVSGITDSGFMVGQEYTDIGAQLNQITGIDLDASQHLVFTLANGDTIDAGLVKELSGLSIDASQHLIANYNDGTSTDLGEIFQGNVNIAGNLTADSIIENMSGYSYYKGGETTDVTRTFKYVGVVKNGNKITLAVALEINKATNISSYLSNIGAGTFTIKASVGQKLFPFATSTPFGNLLSNFKVRACNIDTFSLSDPDVNVLIQKVSDTALNVYICNINSLTDGANYFVRFDITFLLSDSLVS